MIYTHFDTVTRRSRRARRCDWCGESIAVGEQYINSTGVYSGDFQNHHMHPECNSDSQNEAVENFGICEFIPGAQERPHIPAGE